MLLDAHAVGIHVTGSHASMMLYFEVRPRLVYSLVNYIKLHIIIIGLINAWYLQSPL